MGVYKNEWGGVKITGHPTYGYTVRVQWADATTGTIKYVDKVWLEAQQFGVRIV